MPKQEQNFLAICVQLGSHKNPTQITQHLKVHYLGQVRLTGKSASSEEASPGLDFLICQMRVMMVKQQPSGCWEEE